MKFYIGVTDNDWFRFLEQRAPLDEVNFWQPGQAASFKVISPGEPFLFKLHSPENFIVGGGFFAHFTPSVQCSLVWESFGEKNGVSSLEELRRRIEKYRRQRPIQYADYKIGCIMLVRPFFFPREAWIPVPEDFHLNIVKGKHYDAMVGTGKGVWEKVSARLSGQAIPSTRQEPRSVYGDPILVNQRLGQGTFRLSVLDLYQRRCAVTQEKIVPVLQAAHIKPISEGGLHTLDNGILLKSDLHTLYDRGYVTVTPDYKLSVSKRLKDEFNNGKYYYQFDKSELWTPSNPVDRPNRQFLEWHMDTVFQK